MVDVDRAADVQALREQGFEACYVGLAPQASQTMLDNIQATLADKPLPGYEPEDAASLLLQVTSTAVWTVVCDDRLQYGLSCLMIECSMDCHV